MIRTQWQRLLARMVRGHRRPASRPAPAPRLTGFVTLEDRTAPASATLAGTTLTIDFDTANEAVVIDNDGTNITVASSTGLTGGPTFPTAGVSRLVVTDSTAGAGQSLQVGDVGVAFAFADGVDVSGVEDVQFEQPVSTAASALTVVAGRSVLANADLSATTGNVTLSGNAAGGATENFTGVTVDQAITTSGGTIQLTGKGGTAGDFNQGVYVSGTVTAGGAGTVVVTGTGGTTGYQPFGVYVNGGFVTADSGGVQITGTAGTGTGTVYDAIGVVVDAAGLVEATGTGAVSVTGFGGGGTGSENVGVLVFAFTEVKAAGGGVSVTGQGGTGAGGENDGVRIEGSAARVSDTAGGTVTLTGTAGAEVGADGVALVDTGTVASADGTVVVSADTADLSGTIDVGFGGLAVVRPRTAGTAIDVGGPAAANTLALVADDVGRILADTIRIGDATAGPLTVSDDLVPTYASNLDLVSGGDITINAAVDFIGFSATAGTTFAVGAAGSVTATTAVIQAGSAITSAGGTLTAGTLALQAGTTIGSAAAPVAFNAATLATNSGGDQFLAEADTVAVGAGDLTAGAGGTITLTGGTFVTAPGSDVNSPVALGAGASLTGTGSTGTVTLAGGTLAPGTSPGVMTVGGIGGTGTIVFEVNPPAATAGVDYDQIVVNGTVDLTNITLSFSGAASPPAVPPGTIARLIDNDGADAITPSSTAPEGTVVTIGGNAYRLSYVGGTGNDLTLSEAVAPAVVSIARGTPPGPLTNATTVTYTVTFSEPVSGVDAADFALENVSGTVSGTIGTPTSADGGVTWSVPVTNLSHTGPSATFRLNLVDNDTGVDGAGNPLGGAGAGNGSFTGEAYTLDQAPPAVGSIARGSPSAQLTNGNAVTFTVTFTEPVSGVDASDFALTDVAGDASGTIGTPSSADGGLTWSVPVTGVTHTGARAEFRLDLIDDNTVVDAAGNPLGGAGAQNFTGGQTYVVDQVAPTVAVPFANDDADGALTPGQAVTYTLTFSEDIDASTVDVTDFVNAGSADITVGTITETSPGVFTVQVTPTDEGTVQLRIPAGAVIEDAAGNPLAVPVTDTTVLTAASGLLTQDGSGNLVFTDTAGIADVLTISFDGTTYTITNTAGTIAVTNLPGATGNGTNTVTVPESAFTGNIFFNTDGGSDSLTVNFAAFAGGTGTYDRTINYAADIGSDALTLGPGATTAVTHTFVNASDGSVTVSGSLTATILYSGLAPVFDNLSADNRVFNYTGLAETITLTNGGTLDNQIVSTLGESVDFVNPTASLQIVTTNGAGPDTVRIDSLDTNFRAALTVSAGAGDTAELNAPLTLGSAASTGNVAITAGTIRPGASIDTTAGPNAGSVLFNGNVVLTADVVVNANHPTGADGAVTFGGSTNGAFALDVRTGAATTFAGAVGGVTPLTSLATDAGGSTALPTGAAVRTTGTQTYNDAVTLAGNTALEGTTVTFGSLLGLGINTLAVTGNFAMTAAATFSTAINGAATFGRVTATGSAALGGATLSATRLVTFVPAVGDQFNVVDTNVGIASGFAGGPNYVIGGVTFTIGYNVGPDGKDAVLTVAAPTAVFVDDDWTGTTPGTNPAPNPGGALVFGYNAFDTIQAAVNQVEGGGSVTVYGGTYAGAVTVNKNLAPFTVLVNAADATPEGAVAITGAVTLANNAVFSTTTANLTFGNTVNGPAGLTVTGDDVLTFAGVVGGATPLGFLSTDAGGTTQVNTTGVTTAGAQSYGDPVVVGASVTFTAGAGLTFVGTLTGNFAVTANSPAATTFGGAVNVGALTTDAAGTTAVNGGSAVTTAAQTFNDPVTVGQNTTFAAGGNLTFAQTLTGGVAVAANSPAATTFGGAVSVASLATDAAGTTAVNGGSVTTTAAQSYGDPVTVGANAAFAAGTAVGFASTLNSDAKATPRAVIVTAPAGATFGGAVGGLQALQSLAVSGPSAVNGGLVQAVGGQTYNGTVTLGANTEFRSVQAGAADYAAIAAVNNGPMTFNGTVTGPAFDLTVCTLGPIDFLGPVIVTSLTTDCDPGPGFVGGTVDINGGAVTTTGPQTYGGDVVLTADTVLTASAVTFAARLDSDAKATPRALTVNAPAVLGGAVGSQKAVQSLTLNGAAAVNGGLVQTVAAQAYNGDVAVGQNTLFRTVDANNFAALTAGPVTFNGSLNGAFQVGVETTGLTTFGDDLNDSVGILAPPTTVTFDGAGRVHINAHAFRVQNAQIFSEPVTIGVTSGSSTNVSSVTSQGITFASTVDGPGLLWVSTGGLTTFAAPVGGTAALRSIIADGGGITAVNGGLVRTTDTQAFVDAVTVAGIPTSFASTGGGRVTFHGTLTGVGADVAVNTAGVTQFKGQVLLQSLTTDFAGGSDERTEFYTSHATAFVSQVYNDRVFVAGGNINFVTNSGPNTFARELDGPGGVAIINSGPTTFGGAVGGRISPLYVETIFDGPVAVSGGLVRTAGNQRYNGAVTVGQNTVFEAGTFLAFNSTLTGNFDVVANAPGVTTFGGAVTVGSLTTGAGGETIVNGGTVATTGAQTFNDSVSVGADTVFTAGSNLTFANALSGNFAVTANSPGVTTFGGTVGVGSLTTDAAGSTAVNGLSVTTAGAQTFNDPVTLGQNTTFSSVNAGVTFSQTLGGFANAVVNAPGVTTFGGAVDLGGNLTTDAAGSTAVNGGLVRGGGSLAFNDPVTLGQDTTFTAGERLTFAQSLTGNVAVAADTGLLITFGGPVSVGSLTANTLTTEVNGGAVTTTGAQTYNSVVGVGKDTTFTAGGAITFAGSLVGQSVVVVNSPADVTFRGVVGVGSLTTDVGGRTVLAATAGLPGAATVGTAGNQTYGDAVLLVTDNRLGSTFGGVTFLATVDAASAGQQALTVAAPNGDVRFAGFVGGTELAALTVENARDVTVVAGANVGRLEQLAGSGTTTINGPVTASTAGGVRLATQAVRLAADVRSAGEVALYANAGGVTQTGGVLVAPVLTLAGRGDFLLDQPGNDVTDRFRSNTAGGVVRVADANDLTVDTAGGVTTDGRDVFLRAGNDFTATDPRDGAARYSTPMIDLGGGRLVVQPGLADGATVRFDVEVAAAEVLLGTAGGGNDKADVFVVRPSAGTRITVFGNAPVNPLAPGQTGDRLVTVFAGATVTNFQYNGSDGFFEFADRSKLEFFSIEALQRLALAGFVVMTGEANDGTGAAQTLFGVRVVRTVQGQNVGGGLDGGGFPSNPFVVSPQLVNPFASNAPPRLAFGDVNADGTPDVIVANGPGNAPLVTVFNGNALNPRPDGRLNRVEDIFNSGGVLTQFFAYDPTFLGGVNVAVGDLDGDGRAEVVTGADLGGGSHVRAFRLVPGDGTTANPLVAEDTGLSFFAYEPSFTGGVRVAVGDVDRDGRDDVILGAGLFGGPRVTVVSGEAIRNGTATVTGADGLARVANAYADFFAFEPSFRGGVFVDAGDFNQNGTDDILVGAGVGGGSRVSVFDGGTVQSATPVVLANFFAFPPEPLNPLFGTAANVGGVGGVAFGGLGPRGTLNILASTNRGPRVDVREFVLDQQGNVIAEEPGETLLLRAQAPSPGSTVAPVILPPSGQLTFGATVGGFSDVGAEEAD